MKLYILRPVDSNSGLWKPWYDKCFGFVIAAQDETEAREIAQKNSGDETSWDSSQPAWLSPIHSTCVELTAQNREGIVIRDFKSA